MSLVTAFYSLCGYGLAAGSVVAYYALPETPEKIIHTVTLWGLGVILVALHAGFEKQEKIKEGSE